MTSMKTATPEELTMAEHGLPTIVPIVPTNSSPQGA